MTVTVRFVASDGKSESVVDAAPGARLLDVAQADDQPLEGTCEGQMACSTCHVIVDPQDFAKLPQASEMEDDLLDLAAGVTRTSRLACQIWLEGFDALTVRIPPTSRDMQRR
jgi:ferredoxin